jgi:hypothetical protein
MVRQPRGHGGRPLSPLLDGTRPIDTLRRHEREAETGVRQAQIVIQVEHGQLLTQPRFVFAERGDPTSDGRHLLRVAGKIMFMPSMT